MDELRSYDAFMRSLRCFDWLPPEVPGASDIDLMLERHGSVLVLEGKPREGPRLYVPLGQWIALRTLSGKPDFTVWLVAEDDKAKPDASNPRYSLLRVEPSTKPDVSGLKGKQKAAIFYLDQRTEALTLQGLRNLVKSWWLSK